MPIYSDVSPLACLIFCRIGLSIIYYDRIRQPKPIYPSLKEGIIFRDTVRDNIAILAYLLCRLFITCIALGSSQLDDKPEFIYTGASRNAFWDLDN